MNHLYSLFALLFNLKRRLQDSVFYDIGCRVWHITIKLGRGAGRGELFQKFFSSNLHLSHGHLQLRLSGSVPMNDPSSTDRLFLSRTFLTAINLYRLF